MKYIKGILPWKSTLLISVSVLLLLDVLSFYGLYTNQFYFFKIDNYIFPIVSIIHLVFLYVMWFKIKENELSDPPMRNLEYLLYFIFFIYLYKAIDTLFIVLSHSEYDNHLIPATFMPLGITMVSLYALLLLLTVLAVSYRKQLVGTYLFDDMNQHVDNWN